MRKTYKSSNVRFCMEDENQRRTWEYLQTLTRRDSSYGKALSDAFVLVLDGKAGMESGGETGVSALPGFGTKKASGMEDILNGRPLSEGIFLKGMEVAAGHMEERLAERMDEMQKILLGQMEDSFKKYYASGTISSEDTPAGETDKRETEQVPETDMSDAMMLMALGMAE